MTAQGVVEASGGGLGSATAHGAHGGVHDIYAGVDSASIGINSVATALVGVQVNGHAHIGFQTAHQAIGGFRLQETSHILDGDNVGAGLFQSLSHVDVVL